MVAIGLSPGLYWREYLPPPDHRQFVDAEPIALPGGKAALTGGEGSPLLVGAWHLTSSNDGFGSYSALLAPAEGILLAFSDRGEFLRLAVPPRTRATASLGAIVPGGESYKPYQDVEGATRDPATGHIWLSLEGRNALLRFDSALGQMREVRPAAMAEWSVNSGAESIDRLADGRFVVISEAVGFGEGWIAEGLLFPGDPIEGAVPERFLFHPPDGHYAADIAALPDGRLLVLARGVSLGLPPRFTTRLLLADPNDIRAGELLPWEEVGQLDGVAPADNYEGIAVTGGMDGGPLTIWAISDDNGAALIQRTLLLRLEWTPPPREKARDDAPRPSILDEETP